MVRELFEMARTKKACIIFFDEIDAVGGKTIDLLTLTGEESYHHDGFFLICVKNLHREWKII